MKVVVLHNRITSDAGMDEADVLVQVDVVSDALRELGYVPVAVSCSMDLASTLEAVRAICPEFVFNLVEAIEGAGRLIHLAPALLDHAGIAYTGARTEAIFLTSNKLVAKSVLKRSGLPTPPWVTENGTHSDDAPPNGAYIVKSVWEHASIGLDEDSVIAADGFGALIREMERKKQSLGGECFAESFIDGREFNLSLLAGMEGAVVLPPAEIKFDHFPEEKLRVVGYRAKWESESFEYHHTPRCFDFPEEDKPLLNRLVAAAKECWNVFGLRGYARVDFRVDHRGMPWILEVNTNPCLSPDAGFAAAAQQAGLSFTDVVRRIIRDSLKR